MKIVDRIRQNRPMLSFEVFPPKTESTFSSVHAAVERICALAPDFMSVTYGAAGSTSRYSLALAEQVKSHGVTPLAHLTCVNMTRDSVREMLGAMQAAGVENVMALRGDLPEGRQPPEELAHAADLVREIRAFGGFCIGGACYPEGHVESRSRSEDVRYLKEKVDAGLDFLTTQMFFSNDVFYQFLYRIREAGITVPVVAGIMPVTNAAQIARICALSGTYLPERFKRIVDRFGENPAAMRQAGIVYAAEQMVDLYSNGVTAVHVYSMNKPDVAAAIASALSEIAGR